LARKGVGKRFNKHPLYAFGIRLEIPETHLELLSILVDEYPPYPLHGTSSDNLQLARNNMLGGAMTTERRDILARMRFCHAK